MFVRVAYLVDTEIGPSLFQDYFYLRDSYGSCVEKLLYNSDIFHCLMPKVLSKDPSYLSKV